MSSFLSINNITAGYGTVTVLRGLSVHMQDDESIGLVGPNGHGKTTLLHVVSGLIRPVNGTISFVGRDISASPPSEIVACGLIHSPQGNTLFSRMGVSETLELSAFTPRARATKRAGLEKVYTLFPRLAERGNQIVGTLSGGERQMLSIGCALMCAPKLLMLDEPTLGLSPRLKEELCQAIGAVAASGIPLLIVEQDVEFLMSLTDRLYFIEHGEVTREIDHENAPDHEEIMRLYFGGADQ